MNTTECFCIDNNRNGYFFILYQYFVLFNLIDIVLFIFFFFFLRLIKIYILYHILVGKKIRSDM